MEELTPRQKKIYEYILAFLRERGFAPSLREIGAALGMVSTRGVHRHLVTLEKKGFLTRESTPRSIKLLQAGVGEALELPFLGFIAAGAPIEVVAQEERVSVPANLVGKKPCYVLQVKGNSMIEDHILDGDLVVVEECATARDGEVVVALLNNRSEATLKRFYKEKSRIRLQPANSSLKPIYVKDVAIQGKVRGLFRKF